MPTTQFSLNTYIRGYDAKERIMARFLSSKGGRPDCDQLFIWEAPSWLTKRTWSKKVLLSLFFFFFLDGIAPKLPLPSLSSKRKACLCSTICLETTQRLNQRILFQTLFFFPFWNEWSMNSIYHLWPEKKTEIWLETWAKLVNKPMMKRNMHIGELSQGDISKARTKGQAFRARSIYSPKTTFSKYSIAWCMWPSSNPLNKALRVT